jgi:transposase
MAYREHGMWEILEVLRRVHAGQSYRSVGRGTGRTPKTVRRYVKLARKLGWEPAGEQAPDEALAARIVARLRPGPPEVGETVAEAILLPHRDQLRSWLAVDRPEQRGLTLTKVHLLLQRKGVDVSYSALHRFAHKHLDFGRSRTTVRVADCGPGELAEVDFGRLGLVKDPSTGKRRVLHALVVTLVFSRHQYVYVTHSQKLADLIDGLEEAWDFFGGCTRRVVIDNLKAAVTKADRYDPYFQRTFEEYARYRGFTIDAAIVGHPQGKPHVERQVPYVRENFFRGEHFLDRDDTQRQAVRWCLGRAGTRIHGTTRKRPLAQFDELEREALLPLTKAERFDVPRWAELSVHPDCHVRLGNALYSVPYPHKGKKVTVRADRSLVRIYLRGQIIKVHEVQPPGGRSTDYADYPPNKSDYAMRDPNRLIERAGTHGPSIGEFTRRLLAGDFPWAKLRQAQKLLRLVDKYGCARVETACRRALAFELINVKRLATMIEHALEAEADAGHSTMARTDAKVVQLPLRFERDATSFGHHRRTDPIHGNEEDIADGD